MTKWVAILEIETPDTVEDTVSPEYLEESPSDKSLASYVAEFIDSILQSNADYDHFGLNLTSVKVCEQSAHVYTLPSNDA